MILGNDVSNYQGTIDFNTYKNNSNFIIVKATEGVNFTDGFLSRNQSEARRVGLPLGYYHFARPDAGNTFTNEANHFLNAIGTPQSGEVVCLDYEVSYSDPVTWCKGWMDYVASRLNGIKSYIYLNQSLAQAYNWSSLVNAGYPLWIAAYTGNPLNNNYNGGSWDHNAKIQQWTNNQTVPGIPGPADGDVYFGSQDDFKNSGYHTATPPPPPPPPPPPVPVNIARSDGVLTVDLVSAICPPDDNGNLHTTYSYLDTDIVLDRPFGLHYRLIKV